MAVQADATESETSGYRIRFRLIVLLILNFGELSAQVNCLSDTHDRHKVRLTTQRNKYLSH